MQCGEALGSYSAVVGDEAARYESLNRLLAEQYEGHEAESYAKHKAPFVEEMIVRASHWWRDPLRGDH